MDHTPWPVTDRTFGQFAPLSVLVGSAVRTFPARLAVVVADDGPPVSTQYHRRGYGLVGMRMLLEDEPDIRVVAVLGTPLLAGGHLTVAATTMTLVAGLPTALVYANRETSGLRERSKIRQQS